uniref:Uncharacterized protein n=1 Tax=Eubacterium cellulosolvens (strain ATCC 43171 / JCM 9499 / 6) TaxID=633697 RepID=I5AT24_EUBC6
MHLIRLAEELEDYVRDKGVEFTEDGYPIFTEEMLLKEMPEGLCPIGNTYYVKDKSKYLLVSFCNDEIIYKKLFSLKNNIDSYREYMGFGGFDLSPRINADVNMQRFNLLLNKLADAYLALNGVKIMPNFRTGCNETFGVLSVYPKNSWYCVGALGCGKGRIKINDFYLRQKLIITNPDMLIYYGKVKPEYASVIEEFGVHYKVFADFQRVSRGKKVA